ncbi:hypothetical protein [Candidatus Liberibacter solanacearum]
MNPDKNPLVPICFEIENSSSNIPFEAEEKEAEDIKNQTDPLTVI